MLVRPERLELKFPDGSGQAGSKLKSRSIGTKDTVLVHFEWTLAFSPAVRDSEQPAN